MIKRNTLFSMFLSCIVSFLLICPLILTAVSEKEAVELIFENDDEETVKIVPEVNTYICACATWCPFSRQLTSFLNDSAIAPKLKKCKFIFIFENEWPTVEEKLTEIWKGKENWEKEVKIRLDDFKKRAGYGPVFDPNILSSLRGEYYFLPEKTDIKIDGFPTFYSREKRFDKSFRSVLAELLEKEADLTLENVMQVWDKYDPETQQK